MPKFMNINHLRLTAANRKSWSSLLRLPIQMFSLRKILCLVRPVLGQPTLSEIADLTDF